MEEIFWIRSCIEILKNNIKINTKDHSLYVLRLIKTYNIQLNMVGGSSRLDIYA